MSNHETIAAALLAVFNADPEDQAGITGAAATLAVAFADLMRGPASIIGEATAVELIADETPALILAELRKQTTLLEVLAKQGEQSARMTSALLGDASGLPG